MPKKVLVVDNESSNRRNIAFLLREQGFEVDEADDGLTALDLLDKKTFDLLICDVVMPRLSASGVVTANEILANIRVSYPDNRSPRFA